MKKLIFQAWHKGTIYSIALQRPGNLGPGL